MLTPEDEQRIKEIVLNEIRELFRESMSATQTMVVGDINPRINQIAMFMIPVVNGRMKKVTGKEPPPFEGESRP